MRKTTQVLGWAALALSATGCGIDYEYNAEEYARKTAPVEKGAVVVDVIDSRPPAIFGSPEDAAEQLDDLKLAVHEHLVLDGVVTGANQLRPTPKSADDVERILAKAEAEGAPQVMFLSWRTASLRGYAISLAGFSYLVGIIPWIIVDSLPISRHASDSIFAAIVVDPKTKEILHQATPLGSYGEKVNAWGYSPDSLMRDMTGRTLQRALEDVAAARKAGFPHRRSSDDLGKFVMSWPENRIAGGRLHGVGFSLEAPEGWTLDEEKGTLSAPEGQTTLSVFHTPTLLRADDQLEEMKETLAEPEGEILTSRDALAPNGARKLVSFKDAKGAGRPALDVVFSVGKTKELEHRIPVHGWMFNFLCTGPSSEAELLAMCTKTVGSVQLDVVTMPD
jgi:hypothetical protein